MKKIMKKIMKRIMKNNDKIMKRIMKIRYPLNFIIFHYSKTNNDE
jgi:hypothetical protein